MVIRLPDTFSIAVFGLTFLFLQKGGIMENNPDKRKIDPAKMQALRSLPVEIKQSLTREEVDAFLHDEVWPDSLREKLKDYFVDEN
jgi:hypothetical protein